MKRTILLLVYCLLGLSSSIAQKVPDRFRVYSMQRNRTEIILPQVNGYNIYKADFHCHTIYSDGEITPRQRIREAWQNGLDILAITDHLEARKYERNMLKALHKYSPDEKGYEYLWAGKCGRVMSDFNQHYAEAEKELKNYPGMLFIRGVEISRTKSTGSDYNALFVKDYDKIYDEDPYKCIRNAREQGCFIIHNHPAIGRNTCEPTEFEANATAQGLFDGIEIVNGNTFYPPIVRRAMENNLCMIAATDLHTPAGTLYSDINIFRTMTFVFAKENTEEAIHEALRARRTLGYCGGHIFGEEQLLKDFFEASVTCRVIHTSSKGVRTICITNNTSLPFTLRRGKNITELPPFNSATVSVGVEEDGTPKVPRFRIENMRHIDNKKPQVILKLEE